MLLKTRLIAVGLAGSILVGLVSLVSSLSLFQSAQARHADTIISGKQNLWTVVAQAKLDALALDVRTLARDSASMDAVAAKDPAVVADAIGTAFNRLVASKLISGLMVFDDGGHLLYGKRLKDPRQGAEDEVVANANAPPLVTDVLASKQVSKSLVRNDRGQLALHLVFPLFKRAALIGVGVFERSLDILMPQLHTSESDLLAFVGDNDWTLFESERAEKSLRADLARIISTRKHSVQIDQQDYTVVSVPLTDQAGKTLGYLIHGADTTEADHKAFVSTAISLSAIGLITVLSGMFIFWVTVRGFRPLATATSGLQALAAGDLRRKDYVPHRDETDLILEGLNVTCNKLTQTLQTINGVSSDVNHSAIKLSSITETTAQHLATQEQAISSTADYTAQLAEMADQIAVNTQSALGESNNALKFAKEGLTSVHAVAEVIAELSARVRATGHSVSSLDQASEKVVAVVQAISQIAKKTNLLALNAAIEAARAGEHGRGFAVVADEVRTLATKTQSSATEIIEIIHTLRGDVQRALSEMQDLNRVADASVGRSDAAQESIKAITAAVSSIHTMSESIAATSMQQKSSAATINDNVADVRDTVQKTTADGAVIRDSAVRLATTADQLAQLLTHFQLGDKATGNMSHNVRKSNETDVTMF